MPSCGRITKELVFTPARSNSGQPIPYGLGWFVQSVGGQRIVWHYGLWTANSSLIVKALDKHLTLVVLANSDRLSQPFPLGRGDLMVSPVAREFVDAFVTGGGTDEVTCSLSTRERNARDAHDVG